MHTSSGTTIDLGGIGIQFLVEAGDSDGAATVFECAVAGGAMAPPPHSHDAFDETVYGLEGVLTFTIDGRTREIGPGDSACIRRGQVHQFVNLGASTRSSSRSPRPASSGRTTSRRSATCWQPRRVARPTSRRSSP